MLFYRCGTAFFSRRCAIEDEARYCAKGLHLEFVDFAVDFRLSAIDAHPPSRLICCESRAGLTPLGSVDAQTPEFTQQRSMNRIPVGEVREMTELFDARRDPRRRSVGMPPLDWDSAHGHSHPAGRCLFDELREFIPFSVGEFVSHGNL